MYDLPYWSKLKLQYNLDVMHIEKNICENIVATLLSNQNKSKDTIAARLDAQHISVTLLLGSQDLKET